MPHAGHERRPRNVEVSVSIEQSAHAIDEELLRQAVLTIVEDSLFDSAAISLALVDDATIHDLNRRFLDHDYPTDVLSFVLDDEGGHLEGEVIASIDTAASVSKGVGWPCAAELLLYVIHGTLHLIGYNDKSPAEAAAMRAAEERYLAGFGYERRGEDERQGETAPVASVSQEGGAAT